jgi:hypothetical protein
MKLPQKIHSKSHPKAVKIKAELKLVIKTKIKKISKVHGKIDDAFSILTVTDNVTNAVIPHISTKYDVTLHYFQDNFLIASKVILLSKVFMFITRMDKDARDNVATVPLFLFIVIFVSQYVLPPVQ